jgi:hypothetical protein
MDMEIRRASVSEAAIAAGLDPRSLAWMWVEAPAKPRNTQDDSHRLTDEEWAVLGPICPPETRANAWSWREFFDVEFWLRKPRNRLSALANANAHRCRRRRAAEQGHVDRLLEEIPGLEALSEFRKSELKEILVKCAKHKSRH